jgi:UDP-glucose 4-epimerase
MQLTVLVIDDNGFVGRALCEHLRRQGVSVRAGARQLPLANPEVAQMPDLAPDADWTPLLRDVDTVIHAAARVHVMRDHAAVLLTEFRRSDTEGTLKLAQQAVDAGVRRFVFTSSIDLALRKTAAAFLTGEARLRKLARPSIAR